MSHARQIEAYFSRRYESRPALYLPSGRIGLWLAFRNGLKQGSRVLLSPLTCEHVVLAVLAAGMIPVFGPVDERTGCLKAESIEPEQWRTLGAVVTSHLFGIPDDIGCLQQRCAQHGTLLIEDACHALQSQVSGKRAGTFGPYAIFSLIKHIPGAGGILLFPDESARLELSRQLRDCMQSTFMAKARERLHQTRRRFFGPPAEPKSVGHRWVWSQARLQQAGRKPNPSSFEPMLGQEAPFFRCMPDAADQARTFEALCGLDAQQEQRLEGTSRLISEGFVPPGITLPMDCGLLRVPMFVEKREDAIRRLAAHSMHVSLVYDPPLHACMPWLEDLGGRWSPAQMRWCDAVLPIDPLHAGQFIELSRSIPGLSPLPSS